MAGYFETLAFGMGPIPLKDVTAADEHFAGIVVDTTKCLQADADTAKGIDWGSDRGSYRMKIVCDIKMNQKLAIATATHVEFAIYESSDNVTFDDDPVALYRVPIEQLNMARKTPVTFSFISTNKRYFCVGFKFTGGSVANTVKATAGNMLITANPYTY